MSFFLCVQRRTWNGEKALSLCLTAAGKLPTVEANQFVLCTTGQLLFGHTFGYEVWNFSDNA